MYLREHKIDTMHRHTNRYKRINDRMNVKDIETIDMVCERCLVCISSFNNKTHNYQRTFRCYFNSSSFRAIPCITHISLFFFILP